MPRKTREIGAGRSATADQRNTPYYASESDPCIPQRLRGPDCDKTQRPGGASPAPTG